MLRLATQSKEPGGPPGGIGMMGPDSFSGDGLRSISNKSEMA
jgi:hypothetical protein